MLDTLARHFLEGMRSPPLSRLSVNVRRAAGNGKALQQNASSSRECQTGSVTAPKNAEYVPGFECVPETDASPEDDTTYHSYNLPAISLHSDRWEAGTVPPEHVRHPPLGMAYDERPLSEKLITGEYLMKFRREKVAVEVHWEEEPDKPGDNTTVHRVKEKVRLCSMKLN